jgi:hypothetical protein
MIPRESKNCVLPIAPINPAMAETKHHARARDDELVAAKRLTIAIGECPVVGTLRVP